MNQIKLFKGTTQFDKIETSLNISQDFAQARLAWKYEEEPTTEKLWAEITVNNITKKYVLDYENILLTEEAN